MAVSGNAKHRDRIKLFHEEAASRHLMPLDDFPCSYSTINDILHIATI